MRTGRRDDGARVALVLEGGGMRGVLSAATAAVIDEMGLLEVTDLVVGTSAGGLNAAAVAAGSIVPFARSYSEIFSADDFIDLRRILRAKPVVDSPLVIREVDRLFDVGAAARKDHGLQLAVVATDIASAVAEPITDFEDGPEVLAAIKASGLLPLLGGPPAELRGRRWLDGGIVEGLPIASARVLGATHALVLATRPLGERPPFGPADRAISQYLRRLHPELSTLYRGRAERYATTVAEAHRGECAGVKTLLLAPGPGDPIPSRLERDGRVLEVAQRVASERTRRHLATLFGHTVPVTGP